ncbi:hypothetical protein FB451DRAFT_1164941 [Mycena latifolia]|nr:hypothetical protein FB451DRAFT_1164941 [Mycena latifolia]
MSPPSMPRPSCTGTRIVLGQRSHAHHRSAYESSLEMGRDEDGESRFASRVGMPPQQAHVWWHFGYRSCIPPSECSRKLARPRKRPSSAAPREAEIGHQLPRRESNRVKQKSREDDLYFWRKAEEGAGAGARRGAERKQQDAGALRSATQSLSRLGDRTGAESAQREYEAIRGSCSLRVSPPKCRGCGVQIHEVSFEGCNEDKLMQAPREYLVTPGAGPG